MKTKLFMLPALIWGCAASAQFVITPGAEFHLTGNVQFTLSDMDLVNNGTFSTGNSNILFIGGAASSIGGAQPIQFYIVQLNKTAGAAVQLQRDIGVAQQVSFTEGFLDLNGFDLDLGATGILNGEQETGRIIGNNGGGVLCNINLNAPSSVNPANLGAIISSTQNLGLVTIRRGHESQVNAQGNGNSILRYYDITPGNNSALNATLRINYFDGELNGLAERDLVLWKSENTTRWTVEGFSARDSVSNFVEKNGIGSFSRWTLSGITNALPVRFILFHANCEGSRIVINWKTAQEQNSHHFNIEKSTGGNGWTTIGAVPAAGYSNTEKSYAFTDNNPVQNNFYRIAAYDYDQRVTYSGTLRSSCSAPELFTAGPNPSRDLVFINIVTGGGSKCKIKIFDSKGALVKLQEENILPGSNQFSVDIKNLANGTYFLTATWNTAQISKSVRIVKQ